MWLSKQNNEWKESKAEASFIPELAEGLSLKSLKFSQSKKKESGFFLNPEEWGKE